MAASRSISGEPGEPIPLGELSVADLLALSRRVLAELRARQVIRSGNAPAGDYAELLVRKATGGEFAPASQKSWDVLTAAGERLQVKARLVVDPRSHGQRQLSVFRSWDFDDAVIVLFEGSFRIWRAVSLHPGVLRQHARWSEHVHGWRVIATDSLLDQGDDWTERLQAVSF